MYKYLFLDWFFFPRTNPNAFFLARSLRQDYQMWLDLRNLESRMNERYITHESDDLRWHHHAQLSGLDYPLHLANGSRCDTGKGAEPYKGQETELETLSERVSDL